MVVFRISEMRQPNIVNVLSTRRVRARQPLPPAIKSYLKHCCTRSGIHGIQYLGEETIHGAERVIWAIIVSISFCLCMYMCFFMTQRYNKGLVDTNVHSTIYPVYKIPFPAITICNYNRLNWDRLPLAKARFFHPNTSSEVFNAFEALLKAVDVLEFGRFSSFESISQRTLRLVDHVNVTAAAEFMAYECDELFEGTCWWMNQFYNCCEIFVKQKTEVGFCQAFNTMSSAAGLAKASNDSKYPWRTGSSGFWSALRVVIKLPSIELPVTNYPGSVRGIYTFVNHPLIWPSMRHFIPENTLAIMELDPKYSFANNDTKRVPISSRDCLFEEDGYEHVESLPGLPYMMGNCFSQCHQRYSVEYCNCSIELFFPIGNHTPCRASDMPCFVRHEKLFSHDKLPDEDQYIPNLHDSMTCRCMYQCQEIDYYSTISPYPRMEANNTIVLDVHYIKPNIMLYVHTVAFSLTDLMVSIGGIAGLFLGCSLISGIEVFYYATIGVAVYLIDWKKGALTADSDKRSSRTAPRTRMVSVRPPCPNCNNIVLQF